MTKKAINALIISGAAVLTVGAIAGAPFSRIVYSIWDNARTNSVIEEMENKKNSSNGEEEEEENVNRRAFLNISDNGYKYDFLVLIDDTNYELSHYERNDTSSLVQYHTQGDYTIANNVVTLTDITDDVSNFFNNGAYLTGNDATSRTTLFNSVYSSTSFALQSNGTFVNGGTSDTNEAINSLAEVYYLYDSSSRPTYKTIALFNDSTYIATGFALNSKNVEEAAGSFLARGNFTYKEKDVVPMESKPEQTYSVLNLEPGYGYEWASNNGSLMGFDMLTSDSFTQWYAMSMSGTKTAETRISKTGYSYMSGAKTETFGKYSLSYVDIAADDPEKETLEFPIRLEVPTSVEDKPFIIEFNEDGTLTTGWTNYETTLKTLNWSVFNGELTIDAGDSGYTFVVTANEDGTYKIAANFGQMGDKEFTLTADQFASLAEAHSVSTILEVDVASSMADKPFILKFYDNGKVDTGWTNYESTIKTVSWSVVDGVLVFEAGESGYTFTVTENEDSSVTVSVDYGQMGVKEYIITEEQLASLNQSGAVVTMVEVDVETSVEGKPFILKFYSNGKLDTGWTNYMSTVKTCTWSVVDGALVIDAGESGYTFTVTVGDDGAITIVINYGQMGEKTFVLDVDSSNYLITGKMISTLAYAEVASSAEGKPFIFQVNSDHTISTGWTNYESTVKTLNWSMDKGSFTIDVLGTGYTVQEITENSDGTLSVTINFGQMGDKTFTISAEGYSAIKATVGTIVELSLASSIADKPFLFTFKDDGSVTTGWTNYTSTIQTLAWEIDCGSLSFDTLSSTYSITTIENEDGSLTITVDYGQMGEKTFTLSKEGYQALKDTVTTYVTAEVASSVENKPFVFEVKADHSITTGWTNYESTLKTLYWSFENGVFTIDPLESGYTATVTENEDGGLTIVVNYGQMGEKTFTIAAVDYDILKATVKTLAYVTVASSVEDKPFIFEVKDDGSLVTGWTNYMSTVKTVSWSINDDGEFTIDAGESGYTFTLTENEDGSLTVVVNYGQMGEKTFTIPADLYQDILNY